MNNTLLLFALIFVICISECLGQSCLKRYSSTPAKIWLYWLGVAFYAFVCLLLVLSYQYKGMGIVNVLWSGISVLVVVSVGMLFFDEKLTTMDWIGIALTLTGIGFIVWEGQHEI